MSAPYDAAQLAVLERRIDEWIGELDAEHEHIVAVDRAEEDIIRWYVRMRGEEKEFTTVWLTLGQRTFRYETYVMPAPEENEQQLYENLLRRNERLVGVHFSDRCRGCRLPPWRDPDGGRRQGRRRSDPRHGVRDGRADVQAVAPDRLREPFRRRRLTPPDPAVSVRSGCFRLARSETETPRRTETPRLESRIRFPFDDLTTP